MASPRAVSLARVAFSSFPRYLRTERQGPPDSPLPATNGRQPDEPRRPAPARPPILSAYRHSGLSRPVRTGQRQSCCFFQICNASCRSRAPRSWSFSFLATIPNIRKELASSSDWPAERFSSSAFPARASASLHLPRASWIRPARFRRLPRAFPHAVGLPDGQATPCRRNSPPLYPYGHDNLAAREGCDSAFF